MNPMLLLAALGVTAAIIITFVLVYSFAQQQNYVLTAQKMVESTARKDCISQSNSAQEFESCMRIAGFPNSKLI
jgi:penicillin-binding protein-related factor A (putative recombinase)